MPIEKLIQILSSYFELIFYTFIFVLFCLALLLGIFRLLSLDYRKVTQNILFLAVIG